MTGDENATGTTLRASAELQRTLGNVSLPAIKEALEAYRADLGQPGEEPSSIRAAFGEIRGNLAEDNESFRRSAERGLKQQVLQGGNLNAGAATNEALENLATNLRVSEAQQLRALNFQEAQAGLTQTNSLLSNMTGVAGNALSGSLRFGTNALQSDQILAQYQQQAQQQNATYGSMIGTVLGGIFGSIVPGVGTAVGAGAGGAIGGAAGGLWG